MNKYLVAPSFQTYEQIGEPFQNGSSNYIRTSHTCDRCGGSGIFATFGECFKCHGKGKVYEDVRVYTPEEYAAYTSNQEKRAARRQAEQEARKAALLANSEQNKLEAAHKLGFNDNYITYVPVGNTYAIKDTLKQNGYTYNPTLGWHSPSKAYNAMNHVEISFNEIYEWYPLTKYAELRPGADSIVASAINADATGSHYGEIGQRFRKVSVKLVDVRPVCQNTCTLYEFENAKYGYMFIWITSTTPKTSVEVGGDYFLTATVKAHDISCGKKITKINRAVLEEQI